MKRLCKARNNRKHTLRLNELECEGWTDGLMEDVCYRDIAKYKEVQNS